MRDSTLLFLIKKTDGDVTDICLAMKKRGFGVNRWNGVGGKCNQGESVEDAVKREAHEEIGIVVGTMSKVAELEFRFAAKPEWDQLVHTYFCETWSGEPVESEEMRPAWFKVSDIPFKDMWPDDPFWLPRVITGEKIKASFTFGDGDAILEQKIETVDVI
jgi:mutator protein MutT